jgi:hypothetical protein
MLPKNLKLLHIESRKLTLPLESLPETLKSLIISNFNLKYQSLESLPSQLKTLDLWNCEHANYSEYKFPIALEHLGICDFVTKPSPELFPDISHLNINGEQYR